MIEGLLVQIPAQTLLMAEESLDKIGALNCYCLLVYECVCEWVNKPIEAQWVQVIFHKQHIFIVVTWYNLKIFDFCETRQCLPLSLQCFWSPVTSWHWLVSSYSSLQHHKCALDQWEFPPRSIHPSALSGEQREVCLRFRRDLSRKILQPWRVLKQAAGLTGQHFLQGLKKITAAGNFLFSTLPSFKQQGLGLPALCSSVGSSTSNPLVVGNIHMACEAHRFVEKKISAIRHVDQSRSCVRNCLWCSVKTGQWPLKKKDESVGGKRKKNAAHKRHNWINAQPKGIGKTAFITQLLWSQRQARTPFAFFIGRF